MDSDSTSQDSAQDDVALPSDGSTTGASTGLWSSAIDVLNTPATASRAERIKAVRVRSTILMVVMLVVLFWRAQAETARTEVLLVFLAYIVAAVLWVRAQYVDALDGDTLVPPRALTWALTTAGLAAVGLGLVLAFMDEPPIPPGKPLIPGALAAYFGIGHLISRSRSFISNAEVQLEDSFDEARWAPWRRWRLFRSARVFGARVRESWQALLGILLVLATLAAFGLFLLGDAPMWLSLLMIAGAVVFGPWSLSLLSEHAINHFTHDQSRLRAIAMVGGLVGALSLVAGVAALWGRLPALAAAALLALVVALASFTLADIAAVLAIIAFMGITPAQDRADRPIEVASARSVLVAFGDSYMSGEGASTFIQGTDEGDGNECRRARTTWSMITGNHSPFSGMVSFACSGADSPNIRRKPPDDLTDKEANDAGFLDPRPFPQFPGERTQLDDYDAWAATMGEDFKPSLVVLSIGGNDAGFSSIGLTCVVPGSCDQDKPRALWANLDRVENRLRQVYDEVADTFPDTPVAVIPYPDPIHESARDSQCTSTFLVPGDARFVAGFLHRLNTRIHDTSTEFGFHYVSTMVDALEERNLQLCDEENRGRAGVNFIGLRSVGGLSEQRFNPTKWHHNSLHPNERGHAALHAAFLEWLNDPEVGGPAGLTAPHRRGQRGTTPESEVSLGGGDCTTYAVDDKENGCRAQSNAWAFGEAGEFALLAGGIASLVLTCGCVSAVAFFGWRRSKATL